MANYAIILAAGNGTRLGFKTPKCLIEINQKPIYQYSLEKFKKFKQIKQIVLVVPKQYLHKVKDIKNEIKIVAGGKTRNESFELGLKSIPKINLHDKIIVHDAARINLQVQDILKIINSKQEFGTLCYSGKPNRSDLRLGKYNIQTPQFCKYSVYKKYLKKYKKGKDLITYLGLEPKKMNFIISSNGPQNFKITFKNDLLKLKSFNI